MGKQMSRSDYRFHYKTRVRWMDCDAQGIAFNGSYLGYLEIAQSEYFRNLGFSIYRIAAAGYFDSAVVDTNIKFNAPVRVDDIIELYAKVSHIGTTSLQLDVEIYKESNQDKCTMIEAVYVGLDTKTMTKRPVPDAIRQIIQTYETTGTVISTGSFPDLDKANKSQNYR